MLMLFMWSMILLCMVRFFYVSLKEKGPLNIFVSLILVLWSGYYLAKISGILPPEYMVF